MPSFAYTDVTPDASQAPKLSPPDFVQNFSNIDALIGIDHVSFNTANGGTHTQVTLNAPIVDPVPTNPTSTVYSKLGTADNTKAQLFFANGASNYLLSCIKAWAFCGGPAGGILSNQSYNVTSVTRLIPGWYNIVFPAGILNSGNFCVLATCTNRNAGTDCMVPIYSNQTATTLTIKTIDPITNTDADPVSFSFVVIQI